MQSGTRAGAIPYLYLAPAVALFCFFVAVPIGYTVYLSLRRAKFSGLGLGLTVARRMAELIGGAIQVKSEPGLGTTVLMRFPSKAAASSAVPVEQRN